VVKQYASILFSFVTVAVADIYCGHDCMIVGSAPTIVVSKDTTRRLSLLSDLEQVANYMEKHQPEKLGWILATPARNPSKI